MRELLIATLVLLNAVGCSDESDGNPTLDRDSVESAKEDGLDICWMILKPAGCDICAELDWYGDGICDAFCDEPDPDCVCGSRGVSDCDEGYYCDYPEGAECGATDRPGVCVRQPGNCYYAAMDPVCGCDGETYPSACHANRNGVDVLSRGGCITDEPRNCGGIIGLLCEDDEYCNYGEDQNCGRGDGMGVCEPRPSICTMEYDPVCGCNGETYSNACVANSNGVDIAHEGGCAEPPPAEDCRDTGCEEGEECQYCWGDFLCIPAGAMC